MGPSTRTAIPPGYLAASTRPGRGQFDTLPAPPQQLRRRGPRSGGPRLGAVMANSWAQAMMTPRVAPASFAMLWCGVKEELILKGRSVRIFERNGFQGNWWTWLYR